MKHPPTTILLALALAGCAGSASTSPGTAATPGRAAATSSTAVTTVTPVPTTQLTSRAPRGLARALKGRPIGVTQSVQTRGARLAVTVREVIDPLRHAGVRLQPGARAVGVLVQIRSSGPAVYDSSATGDFRLVPSIGRATPALATRGVCRTPDQDFDRYITAGEDRVGCVVFAVPGNATIEGVVFDPHAHAHGRLTWVEQAR